MVVLSDQSDVSLDRAGFHISDLPSREDYKLLQDMDPPAVWRQGSQFGSPFPQYLLQVFWRVEAAYRSDALC